MGCLPKNKTGFFPVYLLTTKLQQCHISQAEEKEEVEQEQTHDASLLGCQKENRSKERKEKFAIFSDHNWSPLEPARQTFGLPTR